MTEGDRYDEVVQAIYEQGSALIDFLTFVEGKLTEADFSPLTAEMDYAIFARITADMQSGNIPHQMPHSISPGSQS